MLLSLDHNKILALLALSLSACADASASAKLSGVSLRLELSPSVWDDKTEPSLSLTFVNKSGAAISVASPLDGSWEQMREPFYSVEFLDDAGKLVPDALGEPPGRCGNTNSLDPKQDIFSIKNGAQEDAQRSPNTFQFYHKVGEVARPGSYKARVRYKTSLAGTTPMELVSNEVAVTIKGGNLKLWECYERQSALQRNNTQTSIRPLPAFSFGGHSALLYTKVKVDTINGREAHSGELYLQTFEDSGALGTPLLIATKDGLATAKASAINGGALVLYTTDTSTSGSRSQTLFAAIVKEDEKGRLSLEKTSTLSTSLSTAYLLSLEGTKEASAALFLLANDKDTALVFQPFDAQGAPGSAVTLAKANYLWGLALAPTARGFVAAWTERQDAFFIATLDAQGKALQKTLSLKEKLGDLTSVWATKAGVALAYHKNYMEGEVPNDKMGFYVQEFNTSGAKVGARAEVSPASASDPHWGQVAWTSKAGFVYNTEQTEKTGRLKSTSSLTFGLMDNKTLHNLSDNTLGDPTLTALGEHFVVTWSDARDDSSKGCAKLGECVGELYLSLWSSDEQQLIAPMRVTNAASKGPDVGRYGRWRELCE